MEVRVAVDGPLPLIVQHVLAGASLLLVIVIWRKEKIVERRWKKNMLK